MIHGIVEEDGLAIGKTEQKSYSCNVGDEPIGIWRFTTRVVPTYNRDPIAVDLARSHDLVRANG